MSPIKLNQSQSKPGPWWRSQSLHYLLSLNVYVFDPRKISSSQRAKMIFDSFWVFVSVVISRCGGDYWFLFQCRSEFCIVKSSILLKSNLWCSFDRSTLWLLYPFDSFELLGNDFLFSREYLTKTIFKQKDKIRLTCWLWIRFWLKWCSSRAS